MIGQETVLSPSVSHWTSLPWTLPTPIFLPPSLSNSRTLQTPWHISRWRRRGSPPPRSRRSCWCRLVLWTWVRRELPPADKHWLMLNFRASKGHTNTKDTHLCRPFSGRWQSSQWLQTTCVPWCHWPRSWGFRNVLWDPPENDRSLFLTHLHWCEFKMKRKS